MPGPVVIAGGGLAALRTAENLRRFGHAGPITIVGDEPWLPYDRPPLSKAALVGDSAEPAPLRSGEALADQGIEVIRGVRATRLDGENKRLVLSDGARLPFEHLVVATGVRARALPAIHPALPVLTLRTWEDSRKVRDAVLAAAHVTVVGAGFLGLEIASAARSLGRSVTVVEAGSAPLWALGPTVAERVTALHRRHGVGLRLGRRITGAEPEAGRFTVTLDDGEALPTDVVVGAIGGVPNVEWLAGSGLDAAAGVPCEETGATPVEGVHAVGDVASIAGHGRTEHWNHAVATAVVVGHNIARPDAPPRRLSDVPYFWSDQHGSKLQCLGTPDPSDDLRVMRDDEHGFLAVYTRDGIVTGVAALDMPLALNRCRPHVNTAFDATAIGAIVA
ncbi:NAD(P)/FAD-dependent oxidoreductase [Nonomuraea sp. NPDC050478]|uniref:NAD(P)/FAD-dependent oxidoreductase n=1 Tax=Nonomuraea sp. NPDC050478 TaxID=3364365 RepID=UPI00378EBC36